MDNNFESKIEKIKTTVKDELKEIIHDWFSNASVDDILELRDHLGDVYGFMEEMDRDYISRVDQVVDNSIHSIPLHMVIAEWGWDEVRDALVEFGFSLETVTEIQMVHAVFNNHIHENLNDLLNEAIGEYFGVELDGYLEEIDDIDPIILAIVEEFDDYLLNGNDEVVVKAVEALIKSDDYVNSASMMIAMKIVDRMKELDIDVTRFDPLIDRWVEIDVDQNGNGQVEIIHDMYISKRGES